MTLDVYRGRKTTIQYNCMDSKLHKYVRSYLFCLGDLYFQTVDVLRGRVTTDIIVIYSPIPVEPTMGVR